MGLSKTFTGVLAVAALTSLVQAQEQRDEDLILCDCGIGDNKDHPTWSTSRQMNWYEDIKWPDSGYAYPNPPDMVVQVPFEEGKYPWVPAGATAKFSNGDVWTAYIEDSTPDGFKAGTAVSDKNGGDTLNCWAYRGRPVSAAINKTITDDAICWSAFVCNHNSQPPARPSDMGSKSSTITTSSSAPETTFFTAGPPTTATTTGTGDQPTATAQPPPNALFVDVSVNPRFVTWKNSWAQFIKDIIWDQNTGKCLGIPIPGEGYNITIDCAGIQIDQDTHMTMLLIAALRDVGLKSEWFSQSPPVPATGGNATNSTSWVIMPEAFTIQATDVAKEQVIGYISYKTKYEGFLAGPCQVCDTTRFNKDFFDPIIAAMEGTYPEYTTFNVQAECDPWMVC